MSYEELEKSLYDVLKSNIKLIELNKKLRIYRNGFEESNEKIIGINLQSENDITSIEKAKID